MLKVLTKRERLILYLTAGVIFFSLAFNFFLAPFLSRNSLLNRQITLTRQKLKKSLRLLSQRDSLQARYNKLSLHSQLPASRGDIVVATLAELENIARSSGIRIIDLRPEDLSRGGSGIYEEIAVDLRAEGEMEGYIKFIYNLENSLSLLRIRRFQLSAKPKSSLLDGSFSISSISTTE
jgi:hypothetical protein